MNIENFNQPPTAVNNAISKGEVVFKKKTGYLLLFLWLIMMFAIVSIVVLIQTNTPVRENLPPVQKNNLSSFKKNSEIIITRKVGEYEVSDETRSVYRNAQKVDLDIDIASFSYLGGGYYKDSENVYYDELEFDGGRLRVVQDADPISFKALESSPYYNFGVDKKSLFFQGVKEINDIDQATFSVVGGFPPVLNDKNGVYYIPWTQNQYTSLEEVAPNNLEFLGKCSYVEKSTGWYFKNDEHVFVFGYIVRTIDADAASFRYLGSYDNNEIELPTGGSYAVDKNNVYHSCGEIVLGADISTFQSIGGGYAKDSKNVYFDGAKITNANPKDCTSVETCKALVASIE